MRFGRITNTSVAHVLECDPAIEKKRHVALNLENEVQEVMLRQQRVSVRQAAVILERLLPIGLLRPIVGQKAADELRIG